MASTWWTWNGVAVCLMALAMVAAVGKAASEPAGAGQAAKAADYPQLSLTNGLVKLKVYLPDAAKGYYRGSRFDWSGVVARAEHKGHTFFGPWHVKHDPNGHDAIEGTAEEFSMFAPLGFDEVQAGGLFYKIGVGGLTKTDKLVKDKDTGKMVPAEYCFYAAYKIARPGQWKVTHGKDWVQFVQEFTGQRGWAWYYTKRISLVAKSPAFAISRRLENTGTKAIRTTHYCHNFTIIDEEPIGPSYRVRLPFDATVKEMKGTPATVKDRLITFPDALTKGKSVWMELAGLTGTAFDNAGGVENTKTNAAMTFRGDRPLVKYRFWATTRAACPEPFVAVDLNPSRSMSWSSTYMFSVYEKPAE